MATKKGASKGAGKKSGGKKKAASKKSASKKGSAKKGSAKKGSAKKGSAKKGAVKAAASAGKCTGWKAWQDFMPPGPSTLHVTGTCRFPTHGYKVTLKEAVPQGINPSILLLNKIVTPPTGPVILTPQDVPVHFRKKTNARYKAVTILPEGTTLKVQPVH
jgi:hypothetical protein